MRVILRSVCLCKFMATVAGRRLGTTTCLPPKSVKLLSSATPEDILSNLSVFFSHCPFSVKRQTGKN